MLTQDEGFDILIPKPDSGYLPVSMTISRNTEDLSVDEALEKAMSFYPNVSFEPTIFDYTLSGNIETVKCVWGKLDNDWVICVGMEGENGTVSAWGQGGAKHPRVYRFLSFHSFQLLYCNRVLQYNSN